MYERVIARETRNLFMISTHADVKIFPKIATIRTTIRQKARTNFSNGIQ